MPPSVVQGPAAVAQGNHGGAAHAGQQRRRAAGLARPHRACRAPGPQPAHSRAGAQTLAFTYFVDLLKKEPSHHEPEVYSLNPQLWAPNPRKAVLTVPLFPSPAVSTLPAGFRLASLIPSSENKPAEL